MRSKAVVVLVLGGLMVAAFGQPPAQAAVQAASSGHVVEEAGFSIAFPGEPQRLEPEVPNPDPGAPPLTGVQYTYASLSGAFTLAYLEPPDVAGEDPAVTLDESVRDTVEAVDAELLSSAPAVVAGYPAVDFAARSGLFFVMARNVLVGGRLYSLSGIALRGFRGGGTIEGYDEFVASFTPRP
ncbi:MAG: hypothetical protein ACRD0K_01960 [Egibacteraceae bacterium]